MSLVTTDTIADLVTTTLKNLDRFKWTSLALDRQEYFALPQMMRKQRVRFDDGQAIQFTAKTALSNNARGVGLFAEDTLDVIDLFSTGSVPWRHVNGYYAFDRREMAINRGASRIVDMIRGRRVDAFESYADEMEDQFWSKPEDSGDELLTFGLFYWLVRNATEGFNGGNPAGFSAGAAGISSATVANWSNWTDQYSAATKKDLIKKMRLAHYKTQFKAPTPFPNNAFGADKYEIFCKYATFADMEDIGEGQNENLGRDLASMRNGLLFRGSPIIPVPKLEDETDNPIIFMNWGVFRPVFLSQEYLREQIGQGANQHTVTRVDIDTSMQWVCKNRRRLAIIQSA